VQLVASATEEIASSVIEISRQVHEDRQQGVDLMEESPMGLKLGASGMAD
jgi:hypothetical protein